MKRLRTTFLLLISIQFFISCSDSMSDTANISEYNDVATLDKQEESLSGEQVYEDNSLLSLHFPLFLESDILIRIIKDDHNWTTTLKQKEIHVSQYRLLEKMSASHILANTKMNSHDILNIMGMNYFELKKTAKDSFFGIVQAAKKERFDFFDIEMKSSFLDDAQLLIGQVSNLKLGLYLVRPTGEFLLVDTYNPLARHFGNRFVSLQEARDYLKQNPLKFRANITDEFKNFIGDDTSFAVKLLDISLKDHQGQTKTMDQMINDLLKNYHFLLIQEKSQMRLFKYPQDKFISEVLVNIDKEVDFVVLGGQIEVKKFAGLRSDDYFKGNWYFVSQESGPIHFLSYTQKKSRPQKVMQHQAYPLRHYSHLSHYVNKGERVQIYLEHRAHQKNTQWAYQKFRYNIDLAKVLHRSHRPSISIINGMVHANERIKRATISQKKISWHKDFDDQTILDFFRGVVDARLNDQILDLDFTLLPFNGGVVMSFVAKEHSLFELTMRWPEVISDMEFRFINCEFYNEYRSSSYSYIFDRPEKLFRNFTWIHQNHPLYPVEGMIQMTTSESL